jgi:hypothetical protein
VLLCCTYALQLPDVLQNPITRRIVETIRDTALTRARGQAVKSAVANALEKTFPDYFLPGGALLWGLGERAELAPDQSRFSNLLRPLLERNSPHNAVVGWCLATIKQRTTEQVRQSLAERARAHSGQLKGFWPSLRALVRGRSQPTFHKEVLGLVPAEERERVRAIPWTGDRVPDPIFRRINDAAVRQRTQEAHAVFAKLAHDILGSRFHKPVVDPAWLLSNHGAARHIAEQIAATGNFADMPILADALEDAGCTDEYLLRHCRRGTHVPGCWALDAVLGWDARIRDRRRCAAAEPLDRIGGPSNDE